MSVTQTDIDNLNRAIATGERQVTLGSQSITYRSIDDLIKARNDMLTQLAGQNATPGVVPTKRIYAYYSGRGFN